MTDRELLEKLLQKIDNLGEKIDNSDKKIDNLEVKTDSLVTKFDALDLKFNTLEKTVTEIKEDTHVTRCAVNSLIAWADTVSVAIDIPFPIKN